MAATFTKVLLLAALACPCLARAQAVIEGSVALLRPRVEPAGAARYSGSAPVIVASSEPMLAVVYLEGQFPAVTNPPPVVQMGQQNLRFLPGVLPVRKGTVVEFPNQDDFYHNVFSYSKAKRFDLGRYQKDEKPAAQLFHKTGVVRVNCEIHQQMRGTILVLETPHFTRTDTNGIFRLENLPAGKFVLKAWLDEGRVLERPVELRDGARLRIDFPGK